MMLGHQGVLATVAGGSTQGRTLHGGTIGGSLSSQAQGTTRVGAIGLNGPTTASVGFGLDCPLGVAGTIENVQNRGLYLNTLTVSLTQGVYNLTTGGSLVASTPPASLAATFSSGTLAVGVADELEWRTTAPAGSGSTTALGYVATFTHTGVGHVQLFGSYGSGPFSTAGSTQYINLCGIRSYNANRAWREMRSTVTGTIVAFSLVIGANTTTQPATLDLLVNGASVGGATIAAGATGTTQVALAADVVPGDLIAGRLTMGSGSGALTLYTMVTAIRTSDATSDLVIFSAASWSSSNPIYTMPLGSQYANTSVNGTESLAVITAPFRMQFDVPQVYVVSNSSTVACVATLRVNGADTGVTITVPVGVTGWITGTGSYEVSPGDLVCWRLMGPIPSGGSGTLSTSYLSARVTYLGDT